MRIPSRFTGMGNNARIALVSGAAAALLVGAAACSSSGSSGSSGSSATPSPPSSSATQAPAPATSAAATITITNFVFSGPTTVSPGATVAVTNTDSVDHTVTSDGLDQFDVHAPAGQTVTFKVPTTPGTYPFHCSIHPQMHGSLIVK